MSEDSPAPVLGVFDSAVLKKRPHIRTEVMEQARLASSNSALHTYGEMLQRIFNVSHQANAEAASASRRIKLPPPSVSRRGKKTIFANFLAVCELMKRAPEHVKKYICSEQNTEASIDGEGALVISGRLTPSTVERLLLSYLRTYVKCPVCGSMDTKLDKNNRLLFIKCNQCTASVSVRPIQDGFKANTTKRKTRKPE
jgi:translation initiation factor 2 subunit 2